MAIFFSRRASFRLMRILLFVTLAVFVLFAGCLENGVTPDDYALGGTLSEGFDDEDQADLEQRAGQRGATVSYMESFPMQFDVRPLDGTQCENLHLELQHVEYVTDLGECRLLQ